MSTQTTIGDSTKISSLVQWSVLPDDLLGIIRSRVASPHDRVRFAAVCKSWRAAASRRPTPPVSLLLLSPGKHGTLKHLCGPQGRWDFRTPSKAVDGKLVGSHDSGWVAAVGDDRELVVMMNIFSGVEVMFSGEQRMAVPACSRMPRNYKANDIKKVIFSESPTSSGCIVAAITRHGFEVALCKISCHKSGWTKKSWKNEALADITFCNGELYGLMEPGQKLMKFKIGMKEGRGPVITNTCEMAIQRRVGSTSVYDPMLRVDYIFELHGKPAVAVWTCWLPEHGPFFKVFKLEDAEAGHKWTEVTSFDDYALFLGPKGSKAVQVSAGVHHGFKRDHIYYYNPTLSRRYMWSDHVTSEVTNTYSAKKTRMLVMVWVGRDTM